MEIREGIKYEYDPGKFATVKQSLSNPKQFYAIFEDGGSCGDYSVSAWVKDFKSGSLKLIEYPYKVGDWVVIIKYEHGDPEGTIVQVKSIRNNEAVNYTAVIKIGMFYGASFEAIRPAFKEEIPKLTEDLSYLTEFLIKNEIT